MKLCKDWGYISSRLYWYLFQSISFVWSSFEKTKHSFQEVRSPPRVISHRLLRRKWHRHVIVMFYCSFPRRPSKIQISFAVTVREATTPLLVILFVLNFVHFSQDVVILLNDSIRDWFYFQQFSVKFRQMNFFHDVKFFTEGIDGIYQVFFAVIVWWLAKGIMAKCTFPLVFEITAFAKIAIALFGIGGHTFQMVFRLADTAF